jgi:hypothetical protein
LSNVEGAYGIANIPPIRIAIHNPESDCVQYLEYKLGIKKIYQPAVCMRRTDNRKSRFGTWWVNPFSLISIEQV